MKTTVLYIITLIAAIGLALTACSNSVTTGSTNLNEGNEQEHEHEYVFSHENTRYEDVRYFNPDLSGTEVPADEAWIREGDLARRMGERTVIIESIGVCAADGAESVLSTNKVLHVAFSEEHELLPGQDVENGQIVDKNKEQEQDEGVVLSNLNPATPTAINTADQVDRSNTAGGVGIFDGMTNGMAASALEILLPKFSAQAAKLQDFFADSKGHDIFDQLESAENGIRTAGEHDMTLQNYLMDNGVVDQKETAVLNIIRAKLTDDNLTKFNTLWNGYKAGHYILTRDWRTETKVDDATISVADGFVKGYLEDYFAGLSAAGISRKGTSDGMTNIVGFDGAEADLKSLENELVNISAIALGKYGIIGGKTNDMLRALIIQLGQDHAELKAFYDDLDAAGLDTAKDRTYTISPADLEASQLTIAPIGQQSVKLAGIKGTRKTA